MSYDGVLFDLFGTLVPPFRKEQHGDAIRRCATRLRMDFETCHQLWVDSFPRRVRGEFADIAENFRWITREAGVERDVADWEAAQLSYFDFTRDGFAPVPGALELLAGLRAAGLKVGLVTNCAPDVPRCWPHSTLAPYFDACVFSCQLGTVKPEPAIYHAALTSLRLEPERTLYVGDGSDSELTGAAACGMTPVLVVVDLSNTYDAARADVLGWSGPRVDSFGELASFIWNAASPRARQPT